MSEIEKCPDCGGDVEVENVGKYREKVCQICGLVVESKNTVIEEEQEFSDNSGSEVME